jgi:hypothetical protein
MPATKTLNIFGCSERVNEKLKEIRKLVKTEDTFGINKCIEYFPTTYGLWFDNPDFGAKVLKYNPKTLSWDTYFPFEPNVTLFGACTSVSFAIDFAIKKGYNKVRLVGVLDGKYTQLPEQEHLYCLKRLFEYKHFWTEEVYHLPLLQIMQFKSMIYSYEKHIKIDIPYRTI